MVYYDAPYGHRTSNMLDRMMKFQDRRLYATQKFHGTIYSAEAIVRAHAMLINFCPFSQSTILRKNVHSPFEQINGFSYRDNWLENLLVAGSLAGNRPMLK